MASKKTRQNHSIQHLLELPSSRDDRNSQQPQQLTTHTTTPRQVPVTIIHPTPKKLYLSKTRQANLAQEIQASLSRTVSPNAHRQADEETCEPGSVTRQDCDSCICSANGKTRICTLIKCETTKPVCKLDQTKMADCNYCMCGMNGHGWVCTPMTCPPQVCRPGSTYRKFCNSCTCESHGFSVACTKKHCPEGMFNEDGSLKHPERVMDNPLVRRRRQVSDDRPCVPGERFKNYCNTCTCGSDGFSVAYTRKAWLKEIFNEDGSLKHPEHVTDNPLLRQRRQVSDDRPCVPGERFKNYCNTCICGSDGFSVACTKKHCPEEMFKEVRSLKRPEQVMDNPLVRRRRQVSDDRPCVPGERFKNYCNTCICGSDGFSVACTKKHCPEEMFKEVRSLKRPEQVMDNPLVRRRRQVSDDRPCIPGERFKNDCNTCTCASDGFSVACTRIVCLKEIFNEDDSLKHPEQVTYNPLLRQRRQVSDDRPCVPGERFKNYCNICTCGSDGFSVAYTRKAWLKEIFNEDGSLKHPEHVTDNPLLRQRRQVSDDRPCVPGERFKNYCNTCICGSDGFSVACTRKACPKEIFNEDGSLKHPKQVTDNPLVRRRRQVSE